MSEESINVASEIERMLFPATVPDDALAARRYAARLQTRHYRDQERMQKAATRLNAIAEGGTYLAGQTRSILIEIAESLL